MKYKMIRRRKRQAVTDYKKRIEMLKGDMPRVVVRKSNKGVLVQLVGYQTSGDKVLTSISSNALRKYQWAPRNNIPTAYLTGLMLAQAAKKLDVNEVVLDIGLAKPGKFSVVFAAGKGAADGGLKLLNGIEFDEKRLSGAHIADYAKSGRSFPGYDKEKFDPKTIVERFTETKKKIMSE